MKRLLTLGFLLLPLFMQAQIQAGGLRFDEGWPMRIDPERRQRLLSTTTLFVLQDTDYGRIDEFRTAIAAAWTLTPFKIITRKTIDGYTKDPKYSFFSLERAGEANESSNTTRLVYTLWIPQGSARAQHREVIAEILLHTPPALAYQLSYAGKDRSGRAALQDTIYSTNLPSWGPAFLKDYLGQVALLLDRNRARNYFREYSNDTALATLRRDTLFIPDYIDATILAGRASKRRSGSVDSREIGWSAYFPVKVLSTAGLNELLLRSDRPLTYVIYTQNAQNKFINIFRSGAGLIYSTYDKSGRYFNESDVEQINKKIRG